MEVMCNFMRKKDVLIENNLMLGLKIGFNITDVLKNKN
jgi:hypothetical protein